VIAAMWMREAPRSETRAGDSPTPTDPPTPSAGALPALAGGSPELDRQPPMPFAGWPDAAAARARGSEVLFVAVVAGAATIFFGIIPQPLFDLVRGAGGALGVL
jgi:hypothetical protein